MKKLGVMILLSLVAQPAIAQDACMAKIGDANIKSLEAKMLEVDNNITKLCDDNRIKEANEYARKNGATLVNSTTMKKMIACDKSYAATAEIFLANPNQNICD